MLCDITPPGYHRLEKSDHWYMLVFTLNDQDYYLLQDGKYYRFLEYLIDGFAPLVILLCILCAFWIGRLTSARVTAPITRLADVVQRKQKPLPFQDASDEIGVLARAFAQHSEELGQFLHRERCFVSDTSHELRTPLAIIGGAAETIVHQLPADSHLIPSAERIVRTTQEMQRQLTCLLLSRDPHTLARADVQLRPLIEECITRCQPWLVKKPVTLILEAPQTPHVHTQRRTGAQYYLEPAAQCLPVYGAR
ncbi:MULTISPECIES: histidine kinase dimerization/phospho-acceptor domain-containing protein [Symbiopectobacterium]|uniref:histidine kinase dimerization/phospho-acceptor domain-containing protein n=1 Tax=Symbiopectobacterium TaxID=801 RepID=UPI002079BB86|nr:MULTISPECIES: histidine kinase dimerization/phospho-acceptor domain-containing protein [Symbiopectobacterium]